MGIHNMRGQKRSIFGPFFNFAHFCHRFSSDGVGGGGVTHKGTFVWHIILVALWIFFAKRSIKKNFIDSQHYNDMRDTQHICNCEFGIYNPFFRLLIRQVGALCHHRLVLEFLRQRTLSY